MNYPARIHGSAWRYLTMGLLVNGCNNNRPDSVLSFVANNNEAQLHAWIKNGGDPNLKTQDGEILLYVATGPHGGVDVVSVLLDAGADPDIGYGKYTPLMNSASWCDSQAVSLILKSGANPTLVNSQGKTALQCVGICEGREAVNSLLIDAVNQWKAQRE